MPMEAPHTIESFYRFVGEGKLMASKCRECGRLILPPRPVCPHCHSTAMEWVQLSGRGKIKTYTVIHVAPPEFMDKTPYIVAIVELEEGVTLPGIVLGANPEDVEVGMEVEVGFQGEARDRWPTWPRYYFKPRR